MEKETGEIEVEKVSGVKIVVRFYIQNIFIEFVTCESSVK